MIYAVVMSHDHDIMVAVHVGGWLDPRSSYPRPGVQWTHPWTKAPPLHHLNYFLVPATFHDFPESHIASLVLLCMSERYFYRHAIHVHMASGQHI